MSVTLLLSAASQNASARLAQVSSTLFYDLDVAGELDLRPIQIHVPSDPTYGPTVDALLRSIGINPNAPANFAVYVLKNHPHIAVQLGAQHGLQLVPTGPQSFRLT
jgi:hypothetical protein